MIAEIFLAITALATLGIAILNYMTRPLLVRTIEKHSEDLKLIAEKWITDLPSIPKATSSQMKLPEPLKIDVEEEFLFPDIKEHILPDMKLWENWENFKNEYDNYDMSRFNFFEEIRIDIEKELEISFSIQTIDIDKALGENFFVAIYEQFSRIIEGRGRDWKKANLEINPLEGEKYVLQGDGLGLAWGTKDEMEKAKDFFEKIINELNQTAYLDKIKDLIDGEKELEEYKEKLIIEIHDFISIPLFTGECQYIKRAIPGFWDRVEEILEELFK